MIKKLNLKSCLNSYLVTLSIEKYLYTVLVFSFININCILIILVLYTKYTNVFMIDYKLTAMQNLSKLLSRYHVQNKTYIDVATGIINLFSKYFLVYSSIALTDTVRLTRKEFVCSAKQHLLQHDQELPQLRYFNI